MDWCAPGEKPKLIGGLKRAVNRFEVCLVM